jgi:uncharacterized membrane protein YvbJ
MKQCPFCLGQVPDAATKCQHCGEWLDRQRAPDANATLGEAANRYVNFQMTTSLIGLGVFAAIFLLIFFFVIHPVYNLIFGATRYFVSPGTTSSMPAMGPTTHSSNP